MKEVYENLIHLSSAGLDYWSEGRESDAIEIQRDAFLRAMRDLGPSHPSTLLLSQVLEIMTTKWTERAAK